MKKMIHIAAVPGLAVLLSACAGPGGLENAVQEALTNPGPGGLNPVQEALANPGPGGLNPVQQAMVDALKPSPGSNQNAAVQEAVNAAVQQALAQQQASQMTGKPLYQELAFRFRNLGKGTEGFVKQLHTIFNEYKGGKDRTLIPPAPHETDDIVFLLKDPWGIEPGIKEDIQRKIKLVCWRTNRLKNIQTVA